MAEQRTFRLRFCYCKLGRLSLLSHLEVIRAIERGIRRAGLPFAVTQGFSPHMKIAFGSALPVGVGSTCELADVYLRDYVNPQRAEAALREAFPDDLAVLSARYVESAAPAVSVAYPESTFEVALATGEASWSVPEVIEVVKKKKTKVLMVDDYLVEPFTPVEDVAIRVPGAQSVYHFTLESKPTGSLRPDLFVARSLALPSLWAAATPVLALTRIHQS